MVFGLSMFQIHCVIDLTSSVAICGDGASKEVFKVK